MTLAKSLVLAIGHGLAELVGTQQSVIARLEDADYAGHSLSMLARIATALNRRLTVSFDRIGAKRT